jgi:hypothetical protein
MTTAHAKRVSLNLGYHSATCRQNPQLGEALAAAKGAGWDLNRLQQKQIEIIFAEFDEDLEKEIKAEFAADPKYLVDLGHSEGTCPLCGHEGIRWLFKITNTAGGQDVQCGSQCIVSHGINVQGAETAELAQKALEKAIRKRLRELEIKAWHDRSKFKEHHFDMVRECLNRIRWEDETPAVRYGSRLRKDDLDKLEAFYGRTGWLNTKIRWEGWRKVVEFCQRHDSLFRKVFTFPESYESMTVKIKAPKHKSKRGAVKTKKPTAQLILPGVKNDASA